MLRAVQPEFFPQLAILVLTEIPAVPAPHAPDALLARDNLQEGIEVLGIKKREGVSRAYTQRTAERESVRLKPPALALLQSFSSKADS